MISIQGLDLDDYLKIIQAKLLELDTLENNYTDNCINEGKFALIESELLFWKNKIPNLPRGILNNEFVNRLSRFQPILLSPTPPAAISLHRGATIQSSLTTCSTPNKQTIDASKVAVATVSITKHNTDTITSSTSSSTTTPPSSVPAIDSSLDQAILHQQQTSSSASCVSATTTCPTNVSGVQHYPNNNFDVWTSPHFKCGSVQVRYCTTLFDDNNTIRYNFTQFFFYYLYVYLSRTNN